MTAEGPDGAWGDNVQDDAEAASGNDAVEHDDAADDAADGLSGVAPGTTLAWSGWAIDEQLPDRLCAVTRSLAHRLTQELPELAHQNPEGGQHFNHQQLMAAMEHALGTLAEVCDGRTLAGEDLGAAFGAAHDGAVIAAIVAATTDESAVAQQGRWLQRTSEEFHHAMWRRFVPMDDGRFRVRLRRGERVLVARVLAEQQQRLAEDTPDLAPLFPPGYGDVDPDAAIRSAEFASLTRDDLMMGRRNALQSMQASLGERIIDADTLAAWMRTFNDVRLVMGTNLEIDHDEQPPPVPWDPTFPAWRSYSLFGNLVHEAVMALRTQL